MEAQKNRFDVDMIDGVEVSRDDRRLRLGFRCRQCGERWEQPLDEKNGQPIGRMMLSCPNGCNREE